MALVILAVDWMLRMRRRIIRRLAILRHLLHPYTFLPRVRLPVASLAYLALPCLNSAMAFFSASSVSGLISLALVIALPISG